MNNSGRTPKEHTTRALRLLEGALARHPDHIAAIHFYIHLVEASDRPERAEPYADRLRAAVPGAGRLLQMPAHVYLRLGRMLPIATNGIWPRIRLCRGRTPPCTTRTMCISK